MKYTEAINILKANEERRLATDYCRIKDMAIELFEKQIATEKTYEEYKQKMENAINNADTVFAHVKVDDILCEFLIQIGYKEIVDIYEKQEKDYYS